MIFENLVNYAFKIQLGVIAISMFVFACVEKTNIWLLCWRYCWSMLVCCLLITLEGSGWVEEGAGTGGPPPRGPPGPPRGPSPKSKKNTRLTFWKYMHMVGLLLAHQGRERDWADARPPPGLHRRPSLKSK